MAGREVNLGEQICRCHHFAERSGSLAPRQRRETLQPNKLAESRADRWLVFMALRWCFRKLRSFPNGWPIIKVHHLVTVYQESVARLVGKIVETNGPSRSFNLSLKHYAILSR